MPYFLSSTVSLRFVFSSSSLIIINMIRNHGSAGTEDNPLEVFLLLTVNLFLKGDDLKFQKFHGKFFLLHCENYCPI